MDLERGAFLIARYAYPSLDVSAYARQLDEMAQEVRDRIGPRASGEETVKALNRYLFTEQGFKGNTKNYYEVENSYLNCVIDRRTGIPISLSTVYLLVGRRLSLPVSRDRDAGPLPRQVRIRPLQDFRRLFQRRRAADRKKLPAFLDGSRVWIRRDSIFSTVRCVRFSPVCSRTSWRSTRNSTILLRNPPDEIHGNLGLRDQRRRIVRS